MEGEEISKEQYGVKPDVFSTNLSILFVIIARFFLHLSNIYHLPIIICFLFLILMHFFLHSISAFNYEIIRSNIM